MRQLSFFRLKIFLISICGSRKGEREVSTVPTLCPEQCKTIFVFRFKKVFINISISGVRTGEREVSKVPTRYPKLFASFLFLGLKIVSSISRFLKDAQVKER